MEKAMENERAKLQAQAWIESICEMVTAYRAAKTNKKKEQAEQAIQESPLSVQVRSNWYIPGEDIVPEEFEILLSTGGPATRIIGKLNKHCEPETAVLQFQDWFKPWEDFYVEDDADLIEYCQMFYFGE